MIDVGDLAPGRLFPAGGAIDDLRDLLGGRRADGQLQHEAVDLRFGQRVGAVDLDRVLGRQDEEGPRERMALAAHGDRMFLHRLQQGGLRLGRGPVDLVGEQDLSEHGTGLEPELTTGIQVRDHVGSDDVGGHQVGRELDAGHPDPQAPAQRLDHPGLPESGKSLDQRMASREQADQHLLHDAIVADDGGTDPGLQLLERLEELPGRAPRRRRAPPGR